MRSSIPIPSSPPQSPASLQGRGAPVTADPVCSAPSPQLTTTTTTTTAATPATKTPRSKVYRKTSLKNETDGSGVLEKHGVARYEKKQKRRSLMEKADVDATAATRGENKWNPEDMHITCNPLSTPYPYSTPTAATTTTTATTTTITSTNNNNNNNINNNNNGGDKKTTTTTAERDEEPKGGRSCGSFLPILSLIPHSVVSFQYLSPKMKFSWWRNKIS